VYDLRTYIRKIRFLTSLSFSFFPTPILCPRRLTQWHTDFKDEVLAGRAQVEDIPTPSNFTLLTLEFLVDILLVVRLASLRLSFLFGHSYGWPVSFRYLPVFLNYLQITSQTYFTLRSNDLV
jgi:hypothetical protein